MFQEEPHAAGQCLQEVLHVLKSQSGFRQFYFFVTKALSQDLYYFIPLFKEEQIGPGSGIEVKLTKRDQDMDGKTVERDFSQTHRL